jgi:phage gp29-like protein
MPTPIAPTEYPGILITINGSYADKVEKIISAQVQDDADTIIAIAQDGNKKLAFRMSSNGISFKLMPSGAAQYAESLDLGTIEFADMPDLDTATEYADRLRTEAGPEIDGWVGQIQDMLGEAPDLAQFAESLLTLYPDLPGDRLRQIMTDASVAASIAGRSENA